MLSQILYEDKEVIVVHKPAGIAVQTARPGQRDVVSELKNYLRRGNSESAGRRGNGMPDGHGEPYLGIVHRLDQPVEGILVFAKTKAGAAALTGQLRKLPNQNDEGTFCKRYYAVLCGIPADKKGRLTDYLYKQAVKNGKNTDYIAVIVEKNPGSQDGCVCQDSRDSRGRFDERNGGDAEDKTGASVSGFSGGSRCRDRRKGQKASLGAGQNEKARRAELEYRILQVQEQTGLALAEVNILTGRFHQIRAQMAHAGMPLLGDVKYGTEETKALAGRLGIRSVALCACQLAFVHPVTKKKMDFRIKPENPAFSSFSQELLK